MSSFRLHPDVVSDLEEIWDYIAEDNPDAADRAVADIFESLQTLVRFPHQGFQRPDLATRPLRFKLVSDFLIAYRQMKRLCSSLRSCMAAEIPGSWPPSSGIATKLPREDVMARRLGCYQGCAAQKSVRVRSVDVVNN